MSSRRPSRRSLGEPGPLLSTAHQMGDGQSVRLRLTRPSDAARVREFLVGLSEPSRHKRFLSAMGDVPDSVVRHFTFYEPRIRLMLAATTPRDGTEAIVGLADVALLDTGVAEIALVVDDEHQGRGVGTLLCEAVASLALRRGATHLKAVMAPDNKRMLRLMERLGETVQSREDGALTVYTRIEPGAVRSAA